MKMKFFFLFDSSIIYSMYNVYIYPRGQIKPYFSVYFKLSLWICDFVERISYKFQLY